MENASKALIIAGAILLSILIIGLGMSVFNQASDVLQDTGMTEQQIRTYNEDFSNYEGTNVSGSSVRRLLETVLSHNRQHTDDTSLQIGVKFTDVDGAKSTEEKTDKDFEGAVTNSNISESKSAIKTGSSYKVTFNYSNEGRIVNVNIARNTGS